MVTQEKTEVDEQIAAAAHPPPEELPKMEEVVTPDVVNQVISSYKPGAKLVSYSAYLATKTGDNYLSIIYATDILLEDPSTKHVELLQVMLKTIPRSEMRLEMINDLGAFRKEADVYSNVFPYLVQFQEDLGIPPELQVAPWPKCYTLHVDGKTDFLAMENLRALGYRMGDRMLGLDFNHCSLVLRNLARYHAVTFAKFGGSRQAILEQFPGLQHGMFQKDSKTAEMTGQFFSQSFRSTGDSLRKSGEELAASRMEKLAAADLTSVMADLVEKDVEHNVILFGDCWVNNFLFKYEEHDKAGRFPVGMKFLDFQLATPSSRLVDLFYFLMTSAKLDVLEKREGDLLMTYFAEFTGFASVLGVDTEAKGLTWEEFLKEAKKYRLYGVCLGLLLAPMLAANASNIPDMDSFTKEDMENPEEAMKQFYKDMESNAAVLKSKMIVLDQLPKCDGAEKYL